MSTALVAGWAVATYQLGGGASMLFATSRFFLFLVGFAVMLYVAVLAGVEVYAVTRRKRRQQCTRGASVPDRLGPELAWHPNRGPRGSWVITAAQAHS